MKVGDYIRTKKGTIYKFTSTNNMALNGAKKYAVKSSPNIIDLIEVGDYVNGMPVYEYDNHLVVNQLDGSYLYIEELRKIKSIVTKEQFESMEYKIESEE